MNVAIVVKRTGHAAKPRSFGVLALGRRLRVEIARAG